MLGRRHLPGTQEASGNTEPMSRHGLLTWWQHRSRRMDLEVLARVREGLNGLDTEPNGAGSVSPSPAGTADERASAPPTSMAGYSRATRICAVCSRRPWTCSETGCSEPSFGS
jgi:hypothetical protein